MRVVSIILRMFRQISWKEIQLFCQTIINLFSIIQCKGKFLRLFQKINALYVFLLLLSHVTIRFGMQKGVVL